MALDRVMIGERIRKIREETIETPLCRRSLKLIVNSFIRNDLHDVHLQNSFIPKQFWNRLC